MTKIFEPILPFANWRDSLTFSPGVRVGKQLWTSGLTAADEEGRLVGRGDIARQTEYIFEKIGKILNAAGGDFSNIVETTEYVLSFDDYSKTAEVRRRIFGGPPYPAATGVMVAGLVRPGALIEIKAVAVLP
jgi:enamine deaminase RidA (YjgF/YER057c/UK114 family)